MHRVPGDRYGLLTHKGGERSGRMATGQRSNRPQTTDPRDAG